MPTAEPLIERHRSLVKAALALDNDPPASDRSRSMVAAIIVVAAAAGLVVGSAIAPRSTAAETQRSAQRVTWVERWVPKKHEPAHPASRGPKPKPPPTKRKARDSKPDPRAHRPTPAPKAPNEAAAQPQALRAAAGDGGVREAARGLALRARPAPLGAAKG